MIYPVDTSDLNLSCPGTGPQPTILFMVYGDAAFTRSDLVIRKGVGVTSDNAPPIKITII